MVLCWLTTYLITIYAVDCKLDGHYVEAAYYVNRVDFYDQIVTIVQIVTFEIVQDELRFPLSFSCN